MITKSRKVKLLLIAILIYYLAHPLYDSYMESTVKSYLTDAIVEDCGECNDCDRLIVMLDHGPDLHLPDVLDWDGIAVGSTYEFGIIEERNGKSFIQTIKLIEE